MRNDTWSVTKLARRNEGYLLGIVLLALAAGVFFTRLGFYPLFNPDEALYAEPAREMAETHNFLTPTLNYQTYFTKPPLSIWMEALSYQALGINELAARAFSAACAVTLVMGLFSFLSQHVNKRLAFIGALSLLSAPMFVAVGRMSITDMPLSLFVAGSLMCFFDAHQQHKKWKVFAGYVLMGLAVMTKGPIGMILPVVILFIYHLVRRNLREAALFYALQWGALIVAAISLPWFLGEIMITRGAYFYQFILRENFQRFTSVIDGHRGPWWYHILAMSAGYFPWVVFIPQAVARVLPNRDQSIQPIHDVTPNAAPNVAPNATSDLLLFSSITVVCTLVFFSLSVSKLLPYTLPAYPALACILALELEYIFTHRAWRRLLAPLSVLLAVYSAAGLIVPVIFHKLKHIPYELLSVAAGYIAFQTSLALVVVMLVLFARTRAAVLLFFVATLGSSIYFGSSALNRVSQIWEEPIPTLSRLAASLNEPIFVYRIRKPSVLFYARKETVLSPNQLFVNRTMEQELPKYPRACIIAGVPDLRLFSGDYRFKLLMKQGNFVLIQWVRD